MKLFAHIEDGVAIVRKPGGFLIQTQLYARDGKVYIKVASGFLHVKDKFDNVYLTGNTGYKVIELDGAMIKLDGNKAPVYVTGWQSPISRI